MTVQVARSPTLSSLLPHIGLPDWKLGQRHQTSDDDARARHRRGSSRKTDIAERRESISRSKRIDRTSDKDKRRSPPRHHRERELGSSRRRPERGERPPQMEIEFVSDTDGKNPRDDNDSKHHKTSAENALFSFPWKRPSRAEHTTGANGRSGERGRDDSERGRSGVPSVIFAVQDSIHGATAGLLSITASSTGQTRSATKSPTSQTAVSILKQRLQSQVQSSVPERYRRHRHQHEKLQNQTQNSPLPALPPHPRRQQHQRQRQRRNRSQQPEEDSLTEDREPIEPKPQVPILVGGQEDPIPCSASLMGSVHRRYSLGTDGRGETKRRAPSHPHIALKHTMNDLTGLESVSTYELEQRYMVKETQGESAQIADNGVEQIALPKLTHSKSEGRHTYGRTTGSDTRRVTSGALDPTKQHQGKRRSVSPPGRIGNKIVYNLSNSSQQRQMKVHASIKAHSASISDSLERMRFNLRQKQSLLSHAVFDMNARQKHEEMAPIADRLRNNLSVSERRPDTVPLLKNQNYISDIFSDIASKMTHSSNKMAKQKDGSDEPGRLTKAPYMPTVGALIESQRHGMTNNVSRRSKSRERVREDRPYDEASPTTGRGQPRPQTEHFSTSTPIPTSWPAVAQRITSIDIDNPCSMTSPITEQFSTFMPQSSHAKKDPSLYIPNIRSRLINSSSPDTKLPFRASAKASTSNDIFRGVRGLGESSKFAGFRDVIDVTSRVSPLRVQSIVDVTDQGSTDASLVHHPTDAFPMLSSREVPLGYPRPVKADVIDVTSLASSGISKTTVKRVICVDEDSKGRIRTKGKLSAMPKLKYHHRSKGPSPATSAGLRMGAQEWAAIDSSQDAYRHFNNETDDIDFEMSRTQAVDQRVQEDFVHRDNFSTVQNQEIDYESRYQKETRHKHLGRNETTALKDEIEEEIVFSPSPTANQGLFEGIWDVESPVDEVKKLPTRKSPFLNSQFSARADFVSHPRTSNAPPTTPFEMRGPSFMSPCSQAQRSNPFGSQVLRDPPQPRVVQADFNARSPMEASATGPDIETASPVIRSSSRLASAYSATPVVRGSSPLGRCASPLTRSPNRMLGRSGIQSATDPGIEVASPVFRSPSRLASSYSPTPLVNGASPWATNSSSPLARSASPMGRAPNRLLGRSSTPSAAGRLGTSSLPIVTSALTNDDLAAPEPHGDASPTIANTRNNPSVLPWAARPHITPLRRQDAPIVATKTPREPEGCAIIVSDAEETTELQEASSEAAMSMDRPHGDVSRPMHFMRASAISKRERSCERSTDNRSVTFETSKKSLSPRKDDQIPDFICTTFGNTDVSWKRHKGMRGKDHPWDKETESTSSSRRAFHDLSTRSLHYANEEEKRRRRVEAFDAANSRREKSRKGSKSYKRSMYDEVRDATSGSKEVIILDEQGSVQHEVYPAGTGGRHHHSSLGKFWDDTYNSVAQLSYQSHGRHWETLGDYSIRVAQRNNRDTDSNPSRPGRSRRSSNKHDIVPDHEARESGLFFDFLCF